MILKQEEILEDGEEMILKVRKHWIVYVEDLLLHLFGCIVFILAASYLSSNGRMFSSISESFGAYSAMTLTAFVLLFWTSFFYTWTKNYFDVWYVTDEHIIAVNQRDMFDREEAFMELTRIQDVFFEREGLLSTLLNYGRLKVQSAGTEQEFIIEDVRNVEEVAHRIMELRDEAKGEGSNKQILESNQGL